MITCFEGLVCGFENVFKYIRIIFFYFFKKKFDIFFKILLKLEIIIFLCQKINKSLKKFKINSSSPPDMSG